MLGYAIGLTFENIEDRSDAMKNAAAMRLALTDVLLERGRQPKKHPPSLDDKQAAGHWFRSVQAELNVGQTEFSWTDTLLHGSNDVRAAAARRRLLRIAAIALAGLESCARVGMAELRAEMESRGDPAVNRLELNDRAILLVDLSKVVNGSANQLPPQAGNVPPDVMQAARVFAAIGGVSRDVETLLTKKPTPANIREAVAHATRQIISASTVIAHYHGVDMYSAATSSVEQYNRGVATPNEIIDKASDKMADIFRSARPAGQASIMRAWTAELGPRMQGVLLTAIRGPDGLPRECSIKTLVRYYRATVIHGLNDSPQTFLMVCDYRQRQEAEKVEKLIEEVLKDHDALPHHYLMHLIHAAQIVGTYHPNTECKIVWLSLYRRFCNKFHMKPETIEELEWRLLEPDETAFATRQ